MRAMQFLMDVFIADVIITLIVVTVMVWWFGQGHK